MAVITLAPLGRGGPSVVTHLTTPYATLLALSGAIPASAFAPDAGIAETWVDWNSHTHIDGSLADDCIKQGQFAAAARVLYSWSPKTLILFGSTHVSHGNTSSHKVTLRFDGSSYAHQSFVTGTQPLVFLSARENPGETGAPILSLVLLDVTSQDFSFLISYATTILPFSFYVDYLAFGVAPGLLLRPEG
jgi:hypothetical protein